MIRRFRLEQKSHYEKLVIAQRISDMLDSFLDGRPAPIEIGAEQGGIEEWDDVVIVHSAASYEHLQVKRQSTPFSTKDPDMQVFLDGLAKHRASRKPKPGTVPVSVAPAVAASGSDAAKEGMSPLDSAFASLARHAALGTFTQLPERRFQLTLMGAEINIKANLTVNHLDELCKLCRQDGLDLDRLAQRQDGPTTNAYLWLTTWCGFDGWAQIVETLKRVTIVCVGNDATLEQRSIESLGRHFTDPVRTLERLIMYITSEASDVSALGCHAIIRGLRDELRPDIATWAQYQQGDASGSSRSWSVTGTYDLGASTARSSDGVVQHMWNSLPGNRKLRIYAPYAASVGANLTLPSAILRMALHLQNGSQSLLLEQTTWRSSVGHEVGLTLGSAASDLTDLPWFENSQRLGCALNHEFETASAQRVEAEALAQAMDNLVWERLLAGVIDRITRVSDQDLADAMEAVWVKWRQGFADDTDSRRVFLEQLLYPATEGRNAKHALRLGPRALDLLIDAVEALLLVAVGVGGPDSSWASFTDCGQVLSIALKYWSGPAGRPPEVRELSDDDLITIIGPSPSPVVILSGVSSSPSDLLNIGMADDAEMVTSMAAERQPYLLVTRLGLRHHLRNGTLDSVQRHFSQQWQNRLQARQTAIETNAKGI